jgi:hypothetical protein
MNLKEIQDLLQLKALSLPSNLDTIEVRTGYTSDMLSCVMTGALSGSVWVTLMAHNNIVAVASLLDSPAIIITENAQQRAHHCRRAKKKRAFFTPSQPSKLLANFGKWEFGQRKREGSSVITFRAELHIHTVLSPCAGTDMLPAAIVETALFNEINLIAITDHNASYNAAPVIKVGSREGLLVLPGMDLETEEEVHSSVSSIHWTS